MSNEYDEEQEDFSEVEVEEGEEYGSINRDWKKKYRFISRKKKVQDDSNMRRRWRDKMMALSETSASELCLLFEN